MSNEARRSTPLFPIGIVISLTQLSARQIRYYEEHELIHPARTEGKTRLFSFNDVDRLLEIKSLLEKGLKIAAIKEALGGKRQDDDVVMQFKKSEDFLLSETELRKLLRAEMRHQGQRHHVSIRHGDVSRFFKN